MHAKQFRYNVIKDAFANAKSSLTIEEIECERRGYKLTKTILGSGAYAKVKMAYVLESKKEKNKRLADDLHSKGHNIVRSYDLLWNEKERKDQCAEKATLNWEKIGARYEKKVWRT